MWNNLRHSDSSVLTILGHSVPSGWITLKYFVLSVSVTILHHVSIVNISMWSRKCCTKTPLFCKVKRSMCLNCRNPHKLLL